MLFKNIFKTLEVREKCVLTQSEKTHSRRPTHTAAIPAVNEVRAAPSAARCRSAGVIRGGPLGHRAALADPLSQGSCQSQRFIRCLNCLMQICPNCTIVFFKAS